MRLILLSLLTLVLVGCGEIRFEVGSNDPDGLGEVGEWVWTPTTVNNSQIGASGYLTNTRSGIVQLCTSLIPASVFTNFSSPITDPFDCRYVAAAGLSFQTIRGFNVLRNMEPID